MKSQVAVMIKNLMGWDREMEDRAQRKSWGGKMTKETGAIEKRGKDRVARD